MLPEKFFMMNEYKDVCLFTKKDESNYLMREDFYHSNFETLYDISKKNLIERIEMGLYTMIPKDELHLVDEEILKGVYEMSRSTDCIITKEEFDEWRRNNE